MAQISGRTHLQIPIEEALDILRAQVAASRKILVVGSDFLTDTGAGVTDLPPRFTRNRAAEGVDALLFVTYPRAPYLRLLSTLPSAYFQRLDTNWSNLFTGHGLPR